MRAYSALDFVSKAMKSLGLLDPGEVPEQSEAQDGLDLANEMIDDWGTQRRTMYFEAPNRYPLTSGKASYTIGVGGNFNQAHPAWIDRVSVIPNRTVAQPIEYPLGRPLTLPAYQSIPIKNLTAPYPFRVYYDQDWVAGLGTLYVLPIPNTSTADLILYCPTALSVFPDLSTTFTFLPGYARCISSNLALEIAADYGVKPPAAVIRTAVPAFANIKRANMRFNQAEFDRALTNSPGRYNIYQDQ